MRVLSSARELGLHTIALSTPDDQAHTSYAHETICLPSVSCYTQIDTLVALCQTHRVDLVHPGYGFLSESPAFCDALAAGGVAFIGPTADVLRRTGDKLSARRLAQDGGVPVLPASLTGEEEPAASISTSTSSTSSTTVDGLEAFAHKVGFPIMIKAVDGGGGRGIRLVEEAAALRPNLDSAVRESPSRRVFAEKAAVDGFRHVEVQILGDGRGNVRHFWDRECSIQRRFQKLVEMAPATLSSKELRARVIDSALRMAKSIKYSSLGTWEFLVCPTTSEFYFIEVNPRLQVEHTITEAICGHDLVRFQLLLALSTIHPSTIHPPVAAAASMLPRNPWPELPGATNADEPPPPHYAVQLRITAQDPQHGFSASIGRVRQVVWPGGNGLRVDTHLRVGSVVTPDFDSLLAKIIVVGADWDAVVQKADRALQDTVVEGVVTNLGLLQKIVRAREFTRREFDTQWLESNLQQIISTSDQGLSRRHANTESFQSSGQMPQAPCGQRSSANTDGLVHKGDAFNIHVEGKKVPDNLGDMTVSVTGVIRNDFPHALTLRLSPLAHSPDGHLGDEQDYVLRVSKQTEAPQKQQQHNSTPKDGRQVSHDALVCPIAGQLVEILVDEGDHVNDGDAVVVVRQMKMELEVRAHRSGTVSSLFGQEEGDTIAVGTVVCSILPTDGRGKL